MKKNLPYFLLALQFFWLSSFICAQTRTFQKGDIFLGQGGGLIQWRDSNGVLIQTINTGDGGGNGNGTGLRIHPITGQLWVTNSNLPPGSSNGIRIIHTDGTPGNTIDISAYQDNPTSVSFDSKGNAYIGGLWKEGEIVKINPAGNTILDHFAVSSNGYVHGAEWVELDCNDSILYYTNLRERVKRYNVVTRQQLTDFTDLTGSISWLFAMRRIPDSTMIVVAADNKILRLSKSGSIIQQYAPANLCGFFGLAATPDGKHFWAGGLAGYGPMYKYNISSGQVVDSFLAGPSLAGLNIHGIAICNDGLEGACSKTNMQGSPSFDGMQVFPNPNNGNFTIQTKLSGQAKLVISNGLGQTVYAESMLLREGINSLNVKTGILPRGTYFVKLSAAERSCIQKFQIHY